jgi:hypothetical protein
VASLGLAEDGIGVGDIEGLVVAGASFLFHWWISEHGLLNRLHSSTKANNLGLTCAFRRKYARMFPRFVVDKLYNEGEDYLMRNI